MLYLYFSNQPASSSHLQLRYVQPWHWRSRSSEGLLGGSNSWEFRGNFSTRIAQHIPQRLAIRIWGGWIFFEYSYHERIELENDFCWDVLIMMMTPPPDFEHWDHLFRPLYFLFEIRGSYPWLSPRIPKQERYRYPTPSNTAKETAGQVHGVMGFVRQGLVAEVTRASISRAIKLLGWTTHVRWNVTMAWHGTIFGCWTKNRGKSPQNGWWK